MQSNSFVYDCIVVGGGHAGVEAALAAARMGCRTAMITLIRNRIGEMSCNPAIGGVGKGQLVKEIDALGGQMGVTADATGIQFRQLNSSKGQAVRSSRCQSDRKLYRLFMQKVILEQENLTVIEDEAAQILVKAGKVNGLMMASGLKLEAPSVVVTAGTFLKGRIHIGPQISSGGRIEEPASVKLADNLEDLGFEIVFFKTGTPPRIDGTAIDFSKCEIQYSDRVPLPFSFRTSKIPYLNQLMPCYISHTTDKTHEIIRSNFHLSPMYSGQINATGVRYCPSIEDKLKKFPDKGTHHVFLEPEGLDTDLYYPNGISTGLPREVQEEFIRTIPGLENVRISRYGYSIEHGVLPPTQIKPSLETKKIQGLFFAGQVNGTTGYEEAAAQGLVAGINAVLYVRNEEPFVLGRHESYIGVLIDDLTTKGTEEPYRMFTSRVEYRLIVREDNADIRMSEYSRRFGLLNDEQHERVMKKYGNIDRGIRYLRETKIRPSKILDEVLKKARSSPIKQPILLSDILKRPEIRYKMLEVLNGHLGEYTSDIIDQIEYEIKYEGFIQRQLRDIQKFRHIENIKIPPDLDYSRIPGLSIEIQQKLKTFSPQTLGQAQRISGITPASISIMMVYLRKLSLERLDKK